jgi:transcriptional regulator with PAS, ATPase and Fis domain
LSLNLQVKLLRVIEKKVIRRLGGIEDIPVSTRIISATNRNLREMVENSLFRRDLYHRLNVVSLEIPPLRSRKDDILLLARHFISEYNKQFGKSIRRIEKDLEQFIQEYPWPGNIRELRNAIERAVLLSDERKLRLTDFSNLLKNLPLNIIEKGNDITHPHLISLNLNYEATNLKKLTKIYAKEVLKKNYGNKSKSAKLLGISRPKLDSLIK